MNIAIIPAAGLGTRMKRNVNKVFLEINKKPIIFYTLKVFETSKNIDKIVVLLGSDMEIKKLEKLIDKWGFNKIIAIVKGGKVRQDTVYRGIKFLDQWGADDSDIIVIHNGANPFVSPQEIALSIKKAKQVGAAVVAHPAASTVKLASEGKIRKTIDRQEIWLAETPQTMKLTLAKKAFAKAKQDKFTGTDDVQLIERMGQPVAVIEAASQNFKITLPKDLNIAKCYLRKQ